MLFNKAAMEKMAIASAAFGLRDTCRAFDVTHDVGVEAYVWLFGVYHIYIPGIALNPNHAGSKIFHPDQLIVHALKHDKDNCAFGQEQLWPEKDRFDQRTVVGCGDIDHHGPFHQPKQMADMYDAWEYFRDHGKELSFGKEGDHEFKKMKVILHPNDEKPANATRIRVKEIIIDESLISNHKYKGEDVAEVVIPYLQFIDGYEKTKHAQTYDIVRKAWAPFKLTDCDPPGKTT